jgi:hypothetical protein
VSDEDSAKILQALDLLAVQVGKFTVQSATQASLEAFRIETLTGFGRVERRLGNLETRVEGVETRLGGIETEFRVFRVETDRRLTAVETKIP